MRNSIRRWCRALALSIGALLFTAELAQLHAQESAGSVRGTIVDQTGKAIAGAGLLFANQVRTITSPPPMPKVSSRYPDCRRARIPSRLPQPDLPFWSGRSRSRPGTRP